MDSRQVAMYLKKDSIDLSDIDQKLTAMLYKLSMYTLLYESSSLDEIICDLAEIKDLNKDIRRIVQTLAIRCNSIDQAIDDTAEQISKAG